MLALLKRFVLFALLLAVWALLLWFGIGFDLSGHGLVVLLAVHLLPPALAYGLGWYALVGRKRRQEREAQERARLEREEQSRQEELARQRHRDELASRRIGADCLAVAFGGWLERGGQGSVAGGVEGVAVQALEEPPEVENDGFGAPTITGAMFLPYLTDTLASLFALCPGAAAFPVLVGGPADLAVDECCALVRQAWLAIPGNEAAEGAPLRQALRVTALPAGSSVADTVIHQFELEPELPGAVLLAFDSPWFRHAGEDEDEIPDELRERRRWLGEPAQGVVAMAVANPGLAALLRKVEDGLPKGGALDDSFTAYWERGIELGPPLVPLARLPTEARRGLAEALPLARLHRSVGGDCAEKPGRANVLGNAMRMALERAMVNAALLPWPYPAPTPVATEPAKAGEGAPPKQVPACDWLVHNAGGVECAGPRLAAVGLALHFFDIGLNPIDEATNFPAKVGDLGRGLPLALLAQAVNKAAETASPACWVHFDGDSRFDAGFVVPAPAINANLEEEAA